MDLKDIKNMATGPGHHKSIKLAPKSYLGFSLSELLVTLAVIGIVIAVVVPAIINSTQNLEYSFNRYNTVNNISEAIKSVVILKGNLSGFVNSKGFKDELIKYLSVSKFCDDLTTDSSCFPSQIKDITGKKINTPLKGADLGITFDQGGTTPGNAAGMILSNGTALNILYNPVCTSSPTVYHASNNRGQNRVCVNIIFDINGVASPNQVGKDIGFVSAIDPKNTVIVGVTPDKADLINNLNWSAAQSKCLAKGDTWHSPSKDELNSLYYNSTVIGNFDTANYWSSSGYDINPIFGWFQSFKAPPPTADRGAQRIYYKTSAIKVRCVSK